MDRKKLLQKQQELEIKDLVIKVGWVNPVVVEDIYGELTDQVIEDTFQLLQKLEYKEEMEFKL